MAPVERKQELLIAWDASKLAFRMGQAVERSVIQGAIRHAIARNAGLVEINDVEAAAAEIDLSAACRGAGVVSDGETKGGWSSAA